MKKLNYESLYVLPIVSIVVPIYNAELYLEFTIRSILEQTYQNFELILIDDGSTDNSRAIIKSFTDSRIRCYYNEKNRGIVYTRNKGLQLAKGKYIGMVDADDLVRPMKFEKQVNFLETNSEFGMVGSWVKFINNKGESLPGKWKLPSLPEKIPSIMLFRNYFVQSAVLVRKACLDGLCYEPGFPTAQDYLMWVNVIAKSKAWNLPEYLVEYRIHTGGITEKHKGVRIRKEKEIFRIQLNKLGIEPTERELDCHLIIKNGMPINSKSTIIDIEDWLLKIIEQNKVMKVYSHPVLVKVAFNRWVKVCSQAKEMHLKALSVFLRSTLTHIFFKSLIGYEN